MHLHSDCFHEVGGGQVIGTQSSSWTREPEGSAKSEATAKLVAMQMHRDLCIANPFGQQMSLQVHLHVLKS